MTREEVLALGVPEERLRDFQDKYNRDIQRAVSNLGDGSTKNVRRVIESMLPMIRNAEGLRKILLLTTQLYAAQYAHKPGEQA